MRHGDGKDFGRLISRQFCMGGCVLLLKRVCMQSSAAEKNKQLHCWLQFLLPRHNLGGGWSHGPQGANGAKQKLLPQPHMQLVSTNRFQFKWEEGLVMSHHAPLSRMTKQEGKVKAYKSNIHGHIQSAIR